MPAAMDNLATNNLISNLPEERGWEYKQVSVTRVPGYGFGIAVSGGRDNPHFASGDPSIAVSDVLASGPAERLLQVNDRIITVNGISLQNVDYATAVQVLRDSGDTVALVIKRRLTQHQHSHSLSASYNSPPLAAMGINPLPTKVTLTKNSKKEDFGIILGCKLFIKDLSTKARDQLISTNQILNEGDIITKINNTNCNDVMSLKEAKKIIDSCKDKLQITIARDITTSHNITHQPQSSISTTGAVNNFYKGDDFLTSGQSYSNQNLYVQPPTRAQNLIGNSSFDDNKLDMNSGPSSLPEDKSNLAPRGRSRGPLTDTSLSQFDSKCNLASGYGRSPSKSREEPPRPPPPRVEDYYGTRRQLYDEDPIIQKSKQPVPDARFITFHKEGSVGIRLTGGNFVGIFVTAVQPGSPASLQGLQPGDKILKVNDMDMTGVTREEAVLFLLSLQDRIELIVQFCKEEYDSIVASQKGDSFYIKTHFHYENPAKGEMAFRSGDVFHVIDTLYNGVVGCWQVFKIGRNNQEVQKGIIPNKSRAEELATAQFNATKKEMSANESRGNFFRRRRSSNRRSKSLGKEHWDDILFSDTMSKFPAYERVSLKHPGFTRPVILFGPIADVGREKLIKDFPDKFICPQLDASLDESGKSKNASNIIRLSAIKDVISTGKHGILDITPNAVERLNYAQLYPIVVFFKADTKIVVKQLRQGLPKSAHKSSKKLLEQCQKLEKVWNHIFSSTILLNDNSDNWYRKVREIIDKQQSCALWMSESKPEESLSDDFLFPMSSLRLSYASSPESDLEHSPGPPVTTSHSVTGSSTAGRLTKASSDPSVIMNETSTTDTLPPYQPTYDSRFNYNQQQTEPQSPTSSKDQVFSLSNQDLASSLDNQNLYTKQNHHTGQNDYSDTNNYPKMDQRETEFPNERRIEFMNDKRHVEFNGKERQGDFSNMQHKRQQSTLHGHYNHSKGHSMSEQSVRRSPSKEMLYGSCPPDLPPRVDRGVKPLGMLTTPSKIPNGKSAHERLFGTKPSQTQENGEISNSIENGNFNKHSSSSLDRNQNSKSDSLSSYDSFSRQTNRIGPNAHDDLKTTLSKIEPVMGTVKGSPAKYNSNPQWESNSNNHGSKNDVKYGFAPNNASKITATESPRNSKELDRNSRDSRDSRESERNIRELERNDRSLERNGREIEKESSPMDTTVSPRGSIERDIYRYSRSPAKETIPGKTHFETKTDYGKYSRNNSSAQDYHRTSHQDLTASHLSIHQHQPSPMKMQHANHQSNHQSSHVNMNHQHQQSHMNHNGLDNGSLPHIGQQNGMTTYKPVPPPKPKNYKPSYKGHQQYGPETVVQNNLPYSHGKSHSNPVDQRHLASPGGVNYYYNMPSQPAWHTDSAFRPPGHYEPAYDARRHASIAYASRSEIAPLSPSYSYPDREPLDNRPPIVDLQGSREQRGSAFELYRKPVHFNMRSLQQSSSFGSQPNIPENLNTSTNSPKITPKLTKTQSFKHQKSESFSTPKFFRKLSFKGKGSSSKPNKNAKKISDYGTRPETTGIEGIYERSPRNMNRHTRPNKRDISTALVDSRGAKLVNNYWGVSLEIPEGAIPKGQKKEIYFVVSDPRLCQNAPPLDLENGETMLSPLVMCGPQGTEFLKPVMLNIPHYANTLPSLGISLKATDSEQDVHTDWDNILLPSNHAANSVAVKVDHF